MGKHDPIAVCSVESLCINENPCTSIHFSLYGPQGDTHSRIIRRLSGHDGDYMRTSTLVRGDSVFNWRMWTGLSREELTHVEGSLSVAIPQGCLLENIVIRGIPNFSDTAPTSRLVFPRKARYPGVPQAILAVWEKNGPCKTVGLASRNTTATRRS